MPPRCQRTSLSQPRPLGGPVARSHSHSFSRMGSPASGCSVDCSHGCTALEPSQICTAKSDLHPSLQASGAEQHRSWWRHERRRERALPAAAHRRPPAEPARCCRCKFRARWSGAGCARAEYRQARWRRPAGGTAPAARSSILVACGQRVQGRLQRPAPPQGSCSSSAGTRDRRGFKFVLNSGWGRWAGLYKASQVHRRQNAGKCTGGGAFSAPVRRLGSFPSRLTSDLNRRQAAQPSLRRSAGPSGLLPAAWPRHDYQPILQRALTQSRQVGTRWRHPRQPSAAAAAAAVARPAEPSLFPLAPLLRQVTRSTCVRGCSSHGRPALAGDGR